MKKSQLQSLDKGSMGQISRQIKNLELEIEKKVQQNNEAVAFNRSLRHQVNNLRKERAMFDNIYNQLEGDILMKKTELTSLIEQSIKLEKEKNEFMKKLDMIREEAKKEQEAFEKNCEGVLKAVNDGCSFGGFGETRNHIEEQSVFTTHETPHTTTHHLKNSEKRPDGKIKTFGDDESNLEGTLGAKKEEVSNNLGVPITTQRSGGINASGFKTSNSINPKKMATMNGRRSSMKLDIEEIQRKTSLENIEKISPNSKKAEEYKELFGKVLAETQLPDIESVLKYHGQAESINKQLSDESKTLDDEVFPLSQCKSSKSW